MFNKNKNKKENIPEEKPTRKQEILSWVKCIVAAIILAFLVSHFVIVNSRIPSGSMENTIMTGDKLIALRTSYWFGEPKRGDIVVFKYPDDPEQLFIKRIIGEPGDKVEIINGKVYINDSEEPLDEPYLKETMEGSYGPYYVPDGCYFMMGDNRNDSLDSRFWTDKFVKKSAILGKAKLRYSPSIDLIDSATYSTSIPEAKDYSDEQTTEEVTEFKSNNQTMTVQDLETGINFTASGSKAVFILDNTFDNALNYVIDLYDADTQDILGEIAVSEAEDEDSRSFQFSGLTKGTDYYVEMYPQNSAGTDEEYDKIEQSNADCSVTLKQK